MAYYDGDGKVYVYSEGQINLNRDSSDLFRNFKSVTYIGVENVKATNLANMNSMFNGCHKLTTIDVSNFDTSNVTNMYYLFGECSKLTSVDISNFDTSNVTSIGGIVFTS